MISEENLSKIQQNRRLDSVPLKILIDVLVELEMMGALKTGKWEEKGGNEHELS